MEIERKFSVKALPENLDSYEHFEITQAYIFFDPALRLRKQGDKFILTMKSSGGLVRQEYEMEISEAEFNVMMKKAEGYAISKTRYKIPLKNGLICELDIFHGRFSPLITVETEFESVDRANEFVPPQWFGGELTNDKRYANGSLAKTGEVPK